jgi:hypothetical protein
MSSSSNSSLSPTISSITSSKDTRPEVPHTHQQQLKHFSYFENPLTNYLTFIFAQNGSVKVTQSKSSYLSVVINL